MTTLAKRLRALAVYSDDAATLHEAARIAEQYARLLEAAQYALVRTRIVAATDKPALWAVVHKLESAIDPQ